jgi:hypothetical protein
LSTGCILHEAGTFVKKEFCRFLKEKHFLFKGF